MRNQGCGDNRLAEGRCRGEHAVVVGDKSIESLRLWLPQFALEGHIRRQCHAAFAMIVQIDSGAVAFDEIDHLVEATSRQSDMSCMKLGA